MEDRKTPSYLPLPLLNMIMTYNWTKSINKYNSIIMMVGWCKVDIYIM